MTAPAHQAQSLLRTETGMFMGGQNRGMRGHTQHLSQGEEAPRKHACLVSGLGEGLSTSWGDRSLSKQANVQIIRAGTFSLRHPEQNVTLNRF